MTQVHDGHQWVEFDEVEVITELRELKARLDSVERTVEGMQILLGKASEYKARPRREKRLPR
jgi:hypothetical protein